MWRRGRDSRLRPTSSLRPKPAEEQRRARVHSAVRPAEPPWRINSIIQLLHRNRGAIPAPARRRTAAHHAGLGADRNLERCGHSARSCAARNRCRLRPLRSASVENQKVNSLAYCSQAVLAAAEDMKEAAVGAAPRSRRRAKSGAGQGFEPETIAAFLRRNAELLEAAKLPRQAGVSVHAVAEESAATLRKLAEETENKKPLKAGGLGAPSHRAGRKTICGVARRDAG